MWVALFGLVTFGAIGFFDDYAKIMQKRNLGLTGAPEVSAADAGGVRAGERAAGACNVRGMYSTNINVPFFKQFKPDLLIDAFLLQSVALSAGVRAFFVFRGAWWWWDRRMP